MSRDAFSHDPQDTLDTRDTSHAPLRPPAQINASRCARSVGIPRRKPLAVAIAPKLREQHSTRDGRSASPRAYYVRDRAYLLRDSEMHSLKEIGKFRVIAVSDLAKHAYGGNRERMEKDIRGFARQSLVTDKTVEISQKKTLRVVTLTKAGHRLLTKTNELPNVSPSTTAW